MPKAINYTTGKESRNLVHAPHDAGWKGKEKSKGRKGKRARKPTKLYGKGKTNKERH